MSNKCKSNRIYAIDKKETFYLKYDSCIQPHAIIDNRVLFSFISKDWLKATEQQHKESTQIKYHNLLKTYILPEFGDLLVQQITAEKIVHFCNELLSTGGKKGNGLSTKTVSDILCLLKHLLKYCQTKGIIDSCHDINTIHVKKNSVKQMRVLSYEEQKKICDYITTYPTQYNLGILLCLFTGIRIGELCALRWEDISLSEKTIFIHQTMQRIQTQNTVPKTKIIITTPKSLCSIRVIPLPENIVSIISSSATERKGFFLSNSEIKYIEPRVMQNHFRKMLKTLEIKPTNFHVTRHTFATRCIELEFDLKSLSVILGHSNVNITMNRYVHPSMDFKRKNMQRLSNLF